MRKTTLLLTVLLFGLSLGAISLDVGAFLGGRNLADSKMGPVFGSGSVFCPEFSVNLYKGLTLGLMLETGYKREGTLGEYQYPSQLKLSGFEGFVGYTLNLGRFHPFVRLGFGSYQFEQSIDAEHLPPSLSHFEQSKGVVSIGSGIKVDMVKGLYLGGQLRYVPMNLTPLENEIDLGGLRYLIGVGYRFDL